MTISRKQFELANPFVLAKAKKMFRTRDFAGMEQCDLEQQLWCRLTQESPRFDPSRGRWEAFVIAVIEGECASALRAIYAEQRTPLRVQVRAFRFQNALALPLGDLVRINPAHRQMGHCPRKRF